MQEGVVGVVSKKQKAAGRHQHPDRACCNTRLQAGVRRKGEDCMCAQRDDGDDGGIQRPVLVWQYALSRLIGVDKHMVERWYLHQEAHLASQALQQGKRPLGQRGCEEASLVVDDAAQALHGAAVESRPARGRAVAAGQQVALVVRSQPVGNKPDALERRAHPVLLPRQAWRLHPRVPIHTGLLAEGRSMPAHASVAYQNLPGSLRAAAAMEPCMPYYIALTSYISFGMLFVFGHLRDAWRALVLQRSRGGGATPAGYAPLCKDWEDFYTRRMYYRISDVFNRPIAGAPDAWIDVVDRVPSAGSLLGKTTATTRRCLNLGSYNYLGFAADDPYCTPRVRPLRPGSPLVLQVPSWATRQGQARRNTARPGVTRLSTEVAGALGATPVAGATTLWRRPKGRPSRAVAWRAPVLSLGPLRLRCPRPGDPDPCAATHSPSRCWTRCRRLDPARAGACGWLWLSPLPLVIASYSTQRTRG